MKKQLHKSLLNVLLLIAISLPAGAQISAGTSFSFAICNDGTVMGWGGNTGGELGLGHNTNNILPTTIPSLTEVKQVETGHSCALFLKEDGTVWASGYNSDGQLGNGTNEASNVPTQVVGLTDMVDISGGWFHSIALKADGTVWAWGSNYDNQLGDPGIESTVNVPIQVPGLTDIIDVVAGELHNLALKGNGTVWAWGANGDGELGMGTFVSGESAAQIPTLSNVVAIGAGWGHSLAVLEDGTAWAWGKNGVGQLGLGTDILYYTSPMQITTLSGIIDINGSRDRFSVAIKNDGTVWAWGNNSMGQVGNGETVTTENLPTQVQGIDDVVKVTAGTDHVLALKSDGTLWGWGSNITHRLGIDTEDSAFTSPAHVDTVCGSTASLNDNVLSNDIIVYPNPSEGILNIDFTYPAERTIDVYNVLGAKVRSSEIHGNTRIDLSILTKGIYVIKVTEGSKMFSQKIILQ